MVAKMHQPNVLATMVIKSGRKKGTSIQVEVDDGERDERRFRLKQLWRMLEKLYGNRFSCGHCCPDYPAFKAKRRLKF